MKPSAYIVFDLETTGFSPERDEITELAWQSVSPCGVVSSAVLVRGDVPVPAEVVALTGITDAMRAGGLPLDHVLANFISLTERFGPCRIVGHNIIRFDVPFVEAACCRLGLRPPDRARYYDTAAAYKASQLGYTTPGDNHWRFATDVLNMRVRGLKYNLTTACAALGLPWAGTAHRAAGDVEMTRQLYEALT